VGGRRRRGGDERVNDASGKGATTVTDAPGREEGARPQLGVGPGELETQYRAVRQRAGLFDHSSQGRIRISGTGAKPFLERMLTREIEYLDPGGSRITLLLDDEGEIVGDGTVYCLEDDVYLLETWGDRKERVQAWLRDKLGGTAAAVQDVSAELGTVGVEGPEAWKVVAKVVDFDIMGLRYQGLRKTEIDGCEATVARTGHTAEYGYKFFAAAGEIVGLRRRLEEAGSEWGLQTCGNDVLKLCMLEVRFPLIGAEVPPDKTPLEAALNWMIDFRKEDFVGKKALLARRAAGVKELLVCFTCDLDLPLIVGGSVKLEDESIGTIVRGEVSPGLGKWAGVAYLECELAASGLDLETEGLDGRRYPLRTASSPFVIPASWNVKGGPR